MIYIVGLGPNESYNIKENIKQLLTSSNAKIIARIDEHPAMSFLRENNINYETCDRFYIEEDTFDSTYKNIANYIIQVAQSDDVIYLVPGHPMVAEMTTKLLLENTRNVKIVGGESFLDACFNAAKFDPVEGFTLADATNIDTFANINVKNHLLITQCYDENTAADIAINLMEYYPFDHKVTVMEQVGATDEKIYLSELNELSMNVGEKVNNLRTIYVPPLEPSIDYNLKNYLPDFDTSYDEENLVANLEALIKKLKNQKENAEPTLAELLQTVLNFTASEDNYYELNDILAHLEQKNG